MTASLKKLLCGLCILFIVECRSEELDLSGRDKACSLFVGFDEPLWLHYDQNMSRLIDLAHDHVDGLNQIFTEQVFTADSSHPTSYFRIKRVQVLFGTCDGFESENCTEFREKFLTTFDQQNDFSEFCLAYMLTYRDFHNGTAGLASIGTACRPIHNSGFVTMLNGGERSLEASIITLAHEVGHSFNASHDNDFEDRPECLHKGYIMDEQHNASYTDDLDLFHNNATDDDDDDDDNGGKFSPCSLESMSKMLGTFDDCFVEDEFELEVSFCGNHVVEPGEDCDCGMYHETCNDPCCYPAKISVEERRANKTAKSCTRTERSACITPPTLVYGFYVPLAVIGIVIVLIAFVLHRDWKGQKKLFKHVTEGNIRIKT